jgi:ATP-dependent RNA helicase DeaD
MGFINDVEEIISYCPKERQTLLFSATTSKRVKDIEKKHLKNPVTITVETQVNPLKLKQIYYDVPAYEKVSLLAHLLKKEKSGIVMVFCNTRRTVNQITKILLQNKIECQAIHGGLEQNKRAKIIKQFHENKADILICTNVAARGLDIKGVTHVYNYDSPSDSEEYIHRIGRTARAGEEGEAISLVSNTDYTNFGNVIENNQVNIEKKETPNFEKLVMEKEKRFNKFKKFDKRENKRYTHSRREKRFNKNKKSDKKRKFYSNQK